MAPQCFATDPCGSARASPWTGVTQLVWIICTVHLRGSTAGFPVHTVICPLLGSVSTYEETHYSFQGKSLQLTGVWEEHSASASSHVLI